MANLPISQSVLSNLVTEAQLNKVYCKLAEDPRQDTVSLPESFQDQVDAVADAANAGEVMVSLFPLQTNRKRPPEDSNTSMMDLTQAKRDARDVKKAKINALKEAVFSQPTENHISPPTTPPNNSEVLSKSDEGTYISNRWLELYKEQDGPDRPVSLPEIQKSKLRTMFPIIYNTNN
jgi:hypothetical protein